LRKRPPHIAKPQIAFWKDRRTTRHDIVLFELWGKKASHAVVSGSISKGGGQTWHKRSQIHSHYEGGFMDRGSRPAMTQSQAIFQKQGT
jgi:hypothetical protein